MRHLLITVLVLVVVIIPTYFVAHWYFKNDAGSGPPIRGKAIPNGVDERTEKDYFNEKYAWLRHQTVSAFKSSHNGGDGYQAAIDFLEGVCRAVAFNAEPDEWLRLEGEGQALLASGCNDPLVILWAGQILFRDNKPDAALDLLKTAHDWEKTQYPIIHAFFAYWTQARIYLGKKDTHPESAKRRMRKAITYFSAALLAREFDKRQVHIAYRLLLDADRHDYDLNLFNTLLKKIQANAQVDPWLMRMLRGKSEIELAWKARGGGWAKDVTDEGWAGFKEHLEKARAILTACWQQDPARPEAAAEMIRVTMGKHGNPGDTERLWFDRAVASQIDYPRAYFNFINAIRPRWSGSYPDMRIFGKECLDSGRFDTDVPLFYLYCLRAVAVEMENNRWRTVFRREDARLNLERLFKKLLAEPGRAEQRSRLLTQLALVSAWSGDHKKARLLLNSVGRKVDLRCGFSGQPLSWSEAGWETIEAEIKVFTGPDRKALQNAEALVDGNRIQEAADAFEQVMRRTSASDPVRAYLRDRIALLRMGQSEEHVTYPLLNTAAKYNALAVAEFLIDTGAGIDKRSQSHWSPLNTALKHKNPEMARLLINRGADPDLSGYGGRTPLQYALKYRQPEIARLLIEKGADINAKSYWRWTALHYALYYDYPELAMELLQRGADVNVRTKKKFTPLHYALRHKYTAIARLLLQKGAELDAVTFKDWRPLHYALANGQPEIALELIKAGVDVNTPTSEKWAPLHFAAYYGYAEVVRLLLEKGAEPKASLEDGRTALVLASQQNKLAVKTILARYQ